MEYSNPKDDPFRLVKVSDFMPVGDIKTKVLYCVNEKKKKALKPTRGQALMLEVVEPGAIFTGLISVEKFLHRDGIAKPVELATLLKGVLSFYTQEKTDENHALQVVGIPPNTGELDKDATLIRCGRHSGAEAVTIKGHRQIRIKGKGRDYKTLDHATTFWLASNVRVPKIKKFLTPFGWGSLIKLTDKGFKEFEAIELSYIEKLRIEQETFRDEAERRREIKRKAQLEAEKNAKEAEEERIAEEKRKAELEEMSPEERDIATLEDPDVIENVVVEIFNRLDNFSDKNKVKASMAFKKYYEKNNKWKKKKCTPKQLKKVKIIKAIIEEV